MTKEQIKELFNKMLELKEKDRKIDNAFKTFAKLISDNQNDVFVSESQLEWFLKALSIVYLQLADDLIRFIYDKGDSDWSDYWHIEVWENKYDIHTNEDYLDYLIKEYAD